MTHTSNAVDMQGIVKRFPGVLANDRVDFELRSGEIHALLGENGAGKSTLMNVLAGLYRPEEGSIQVHGQPVDIRSPRDAIDCGIGMVHQHFMLVPSQSVTENILLGLDEPRFVMSLPRYERRVAELAEEFGLQVDPRAKIWQLSVGEQQRVEILKMLYRGTDILIMDEPTAVLAPQEIEDLFRILRSMVDEGKSIVFISHKLGEVMDIADRITVLRKGQVTASGLRPSETTPADLARLMVGRKVLFRVEKEIQDARRGGPLRGERVRRQRQGAARAEGHLLPGTRRRDTGPCRSSGQRSTGTGRGHHRPAQVQQRTGSRARTRLSATAPPAQPLIAGWPTSPRIAKRWAALPI